MRLESTKFMCAATGLSLLGVVAASALTCNAQTAVSPSVASPAGKIRHVVELFTSQGCSSCPKADALFAQYANKPDVLALSFSVDYWDYLGWRDTLASPAFTKRQKRYAKLRGDGQVYTPQIVVDGQNHTVGHSAVQVDGLLTNAAADRSRTWFDVQATGLSYRITPLADARPATLWLIKYSERVAVEIRRGENAGKTITYHNVVREMAELGVWDGKSNGAQPIETQKLTAQKQADERLALLLQDNESGRIVGAARLDP